MDGNGNTKVCAELTTTRAMQTVFAVKFSRSAAVCLFGLFPSVGLVSKNVWIVARWRDSDVAVSPRLWF